MRCGSKNDLRLDGEKRNQPGDQAQAAFLHQRLFAYVCDIYGEQNHSFGPTNYIG